MDRPLFGFSGIMGIFLCFAIVVVGSLAGCPRYAVWEQGLAGQAALARATQDRQIKVQEAQADEESALHNAKAEVNRAHGAADANEILSKSLGGPENYLKWKWLEMLQNTGNHVSREVIYAPSGGGLPITEAGRAVQPPLTPVQ